MKIRGKTALVAGATRGIGLAIARKLAARGARLIIPWFDWPEDARAVAAEFARRSPEHLLVRADLRARDEVANLLQTVRRSCGCLHILVNNIERGGMPVVHGSYDRGINREQWQLEMDTILLAKRLLFEAALPLLRDAGHATVVNISSIAALVGRSGPAGLVFSDGYAAANRGISSLTATWARIGAPAITVNELMLGLFDTRHGKGTRGWQNQNMRATGGIGKDLSALVERYNTRWLVADYEAGDMVVHTSYMIHAATQNVSSENRMRLSTDIRYQRYPR